MATLHGAVVTTRATSRLLLKIKAVVYSLQMQQSLLVTQTNCPIETENPYDDAVIQNPWPYYARLRAKGPVVWIEPLGNFALTQYAAVRDALRDNNTFVSGQGAAGDAFGCAHLKGNSVASDPPRHTVLRNAMIQPLRPEAITPLRPQIQAVANDLVRASLSKGECDAVTDLAQGLPLAIVRDLVGLPDFGRENMLKWAAAAFDMQGIQNERGRAAFDTIAEMRAFIAREATPDALKPGSWTRRICDMGQSGALDPELVPFVIRDYINPSLDTTISAIGHMIAHLGQDPESYAALRADRSLVATAAHEAVRIGTPIRSFSRHAARTIEIGGVTIPEGARVMMLYASANRDEAMFPAPDRFDIRRRNVRRHLGFGAGIHMCVGMHLALLEIECLLTALLDQVAALSVTPGAMTANNTICAYSRLPTKLEAAQTPAPT